MFKTFLCADELSSKDYRKSVARGWQRNLIGT